MLYAICNTRVRVVSSRAPTVDVYPTMNVPSRVFTPPRSGERALMAIRILAQHERPLSLAEMSIAIDIPKTSLFAILKGLVLSGYVAFEEGKYSLGPESHRLGRIISEGRAFPGCALPVLERLGKEIGETIILCTVSGDRRHVVYVAVVEAESWLRFSVEVGTERPLNASASGHAILSFLAPAERERYLASGRFERFTPRTVASRAGLRTAIAKVRREGCAMTVDGTVAGAIGIAAPYFDHQGAVAGALVIAAPTTRMVDRQSEVKAAVKRGGEEISRILDYTGIYPP